MIDETLTAARAAHFAGTLLIEGCVVFQIFVAAPALGGEDDEAFRSFLNRTMAAAWALAVLSGAVWLVLLAAEIGGSSVSVALSDGTAWALLTQTQFGTGWTVRAAGFVLLAARLPSLRRPGASALTRALSLVLAFALAGSLAWSGHGAATPGATGDLHLAADVLHLIASGIWLGGLLPYAAFLVIRPQSAADATQRFSSLATLSVLILLPSGLVNGWTILPGLDALTGTLYGRLLLAKIGLFLLMLVFAAVNRFVLTPRLAAAHSENARSRLVIHSGCEIALGMIILALVGVLGTLTPMKLMDEHQQHMTDIEMSAPR